MSRIDGHAFITEYAVRMLRRDCAQDPVAQSLRHHSPAANSVYRDLQDIVLRGHWTNEGQRHHFMRHRTGDQTVLEAYHEAVAWIRSNSILASQRIASVGRDHLVPGRRSPRSGETCSVPSFRLRGSDGVDRTRARGLIGYALQPIGNAVHCVQDSFSRSHVTRQRYNDPLRPGAIEHILRYIGEEREGHEEMDLEWQGLSTFGRAAVYATYELLTVIIAGAYEFISSENHVRMGSVYAQPLAQIDQRLPRFHSPRGARGFSAFQNTWLRASDALLEGAP